LSALRMIFWCHSAATSDLLVRAMRATSNEISPLFEPIGFVQPVA
jgi:hypothetical protein